MSEWVNGWVFEIEVFDARRQQPRFDEIISTATAQFVSSRRSQSIGIKTTHQLVPIKQAQSDKKPSEAGAMAPTLQRREVMVQNETRSTSSVAGQSQSSQRMGILDFSIRSWDQACLVTLRRHPGLKLDRIYNLRSRWIGTHSHCS